MEIDTPTITLVLPDALLTHVLSMPDVILVHVLSFLDARYLARAVATCHTVLTLLEHIVHVVSARLGVALPAPHDTAHGACESLTHRLQFVQGVAARTLSTLAAGSAHSMCLTPAGKVLSWGGSEVSGELPETEHLVFIGHLGHGWSPRDSNTQPSASTPGAHRRARSGVRRLGVRTPPATGPSTESR